MTNKYNENSIKDLSKHPRKMLENSLGTYTNPDSPIGMIMEAIFNSTDELQNNEINKNKKIVIEWDNRKGEDNKGNVVTVKDNGRGIPLGKLETVTSKMNTTGKSKMGREDGTSGYKESVGVNGIGMKLVTYLSHFTEYTVQRDGKRIKLLYKDGKKEYIKELDYNKSEGSFTQVEFAPDNSFFHKAITFKQIHNVIKRIYFLYDNLQFVIKNKVTDDVYEYKNQKGLKHYYDKKEFETAQFLLKKPIKLLVNNVKAKYKGKEHKADFELTFNYYDQPEKSFKSGYNGWYLTQEGEIIKGFKRAYKKALIKAANNLNEKIPKNLNINHISSGLVGFIHCRHNGHPGFESQSKHQVLAKKLRKLAKTLEFKIYNELLENKKATKLIIKKINANYRALNNLNKVNRKLLDDTNKKIKKRKTAKLTEATTRKKHSAELYIVEGDSAGGMMTKVRDPKFHSVLRLKGKPRNSIKTKLKTLLKNEEIKNLIYAMGGIGRSFDFSKLKYNKIVITSDQDVDGSHISALLIAFFQKFYPEVIEEGYLYKCLTPLYVLTTKNGKQYFYSETEKEKYILKNNIDLDKKNNTIVRFKGLGEMNEKQYQKFILGKKQKLQKLTNNDIEKNKEIMEDLLGKDASKKWEFLTSYIAKDWNEVIKKKNQELGEYTKDAIKEYGDYVLEERAIPNFADGLKNVHRRIIWSMKKAGITSDKPKRKVISIIGEALNYHPHGDSSVGGAVNSITADWKNPIPLLEGQGNFGSELDHAASAPRYVEARLSKFVEDVYLKNLTEQTVDWRDNYDGRLQEPVQMPTVLPMSLLLNNLGIAVGTTSKMPSFNLNEVITALIKYVKLKRFKANKYIKGPDFPSGGSIIEPQETLNNNKKTFKLRANIKKQKKGKKTYVVINEFSYKQDYEKLILEIKEAMSGFDSRGKKLPLKKSLKKEVNKLIDECGKGKIQIRLELNNSSNPDVVIQKLYKITDLENNIGYKPKFLSFDENGNKQFQEYTLQKIIVDFVKFRRQVLNKYFQEKVDNANAKLLDLQSKIKVLKDLDVLFKLIKESKDKEIYINNIKETFKLNQEQAEYIARLRTQSLLRADREKLKAKINDIKEKIKNWEEIINNRERKNQYMIDEWKDIQKKYGYKRKTKIKSADEALDINLNKAKFKYKKENHKVYYSDNFIYKANVRKHDSTVKKLFEKNGEELKGVFESSTYDKLYFLVNLKGGGSKGLLLDNYDLVKDKMLSISGEFKEKIDSVEFGYTELKEETILNRKREIVILYKNNKAFRIRKDRIVNSRRFNINKKCEIKGAWEIEKKQIKSGIVKLKFREILKTKEREQEVNVNELSELKNTGAGSYLVPKGRGVENLELVIDDKNIK